MFITKSCLHVAFGCAAYFSSTFIIVSCLPWSLLGPRCSIISSIIESPKYYDVSPTESTNTLGKIAVYRVSTKFYTQSLYFEFPPYKLCSFSYHSPPALSLFELFLGLILFIRNWISHPGFISPLRLLNTNINRSPYPTQSHLQLLQAFSLPIPVLPFNSYLLKQHLLPLPAKVSNLWNHPGK